MTGIIPESPLKWDDLDGNDLIYEPMVESEENVDSDANLEDFGGKR